MLRKILFLVFGLMLTQQVYAEQAINIQYIHELIKQEHGITVPYAKTDAEFPKQVANMKYLLTVVDIVNAYLNGPNWTNYGESEYATAHAADTVAGIYCVRNLIEHYFFTATTTPDTTSFSLKINANGVYHIDWGDGTREHFDKPNVNQKIYSHNYETAGVYKIKIGGYSRAYSGAVFGIGTPTKLAEISGSLGKIFPTLKGYNNQPIQPCFVNAFSSCSELSGEIPADLFSGVHGAPSQWMFQRTFSGCVKLTSIHPDVFAAIRGAPAPSMFESTFSGCIGLTILPEGLFRGIKGRPQGNMFYATFSGCKGLNCVIPNKFFGEIDGAPAGHMFAYTFSDCSGLRGEIPADLFGGIKLTGDGQDNMFVRTFYNCKNLTKIPENLFGMLSGETGASMFSETFMGCTGLDCEIPKNLFGAMTGAPKPYMFIRTFNGCSNLKGTIPDGLFATITGQPAINMFTQTFSGCGNLTGAIPSDLFAGIDGEYRDSMYHSTFSGCAKLGTEISESDIPQYMRDGYALPPNLFGKLYNAPKGSMFQNTFSGCKGLQGRIPETLFGEINGAPAGGMFNSTFYNCSGLRGEIPADLFGGVKLTGETQSSMFNSTFQGCAGLDSDIPQYLFGVLWGTPKTSMFLGTFLGCSGLKGEIPSDLFGDISGDLPVNGYVFHSMFSGCYNLTGSSAKINGQYLYDIWPNATVSQVGVMYRGVTKLSDYAEIPAVWK